jgi:hypothetical protein
MANFPGNADPTAWQRYFAIEANNRAWELSTQARDVAADREMLNTAHAAAWHWASVGTELNHMRATMLLAEVHALLGHGATALAYAREMRDYFVGSAETPDWELAFAHAVYAHAAHAAGALSEYRAAYGVASRSLADIADEQDRAIVLDTFRLIPIP